jgi:hypothetical protein
LIYLGMRGHTITGVKTLLGFGPKISSAVAAKPDGLLAILARLRVAGGVVPFEPAPPMVAVLPAVQRRHGFLDEAYMRRGRMEAVYVDKKERVGLDGAPEEQILGAENGRTAG